MAKSRVKVVFILEEYNMKEFIRKEICGDHFNLEISSCIIICSLIPRS